VELFDLSEQVAIVTGGSRGLGKSMAEGLARAGASILLSDVLDTTEAVEELREYTDDVIGVETDVTDRDDVRSMVNRAESELGGLDILINNAGIFRPGPAEDLPDEDWDEVLDVNLRGQYICAQEAGKIMRSQNSGKIINIASVAGLQAFDESVSYNASKGGVVMLTKSLAVEWGEHDIQVNAICPGSFRTAMTEDLLEDEAFQQMIQNRVPLGRVGNPEELAGTAVYLASDASSYTTGETLVVDGGWTAGL
jgi:NAD(P)-dependent dehydrogenase (short-subunit alcohol dehydrogenase family)